MELRLRLRLARGDGARGAACSDGRAARAAKGHGQSRGGQEVTWSISRQCRSRTRALGRSSRPIASCAPRNSAMIFCRLVEERGSGVPPPSRPRGLGANRASCTAPVPALGAARWRVVCKVVSSLRGWSPPCTLRGCSSGGSAVGAVQQRGGAARGAASRGCRCERGDRPAISEPMARTEAGSIERPARRELKVASSRPDGTSN